MVLWSVLGRCQEYTLPHAAILCCLAQSTPASYTARPAASATPVSSPEAGPAWHTRQTQPLHPRCSLVQCPIAHQDPQITIWHACAPVTSMHAARMGMEACAMAGTGGLQPRMRASVLLTRSAPQQRSMRDECRRMRIARTAATPGRWDTSARLCQYAFAANKGWRRERMARRS